MASAQDKELAADLAKSLESATTLMQDLLGEIKDNATSLALLNQKLESLREMVDTLSRIVRDGNGKGSMVTRLALVEKSVSDMEKYLEEVASKVVKIENGMSAALVKETKSAKEFKKEKVLAGIKLAGIMAPGVISLAIMLVEILSGTK